MDKIVSLIFFITLLIQVDNQLLLPGRCPDIPPMKNFIPEKFLGRWYEIERTFVNYETITGDCWVDNHMFKKEGGFVLNVEWRDLVLNKSRSMEMEIEFHSEEKARISYMVQHPKFPIHTGEYVILDTDYKTYALDWQCKELPLKQGHSQIIWLMSKQPRPSEKTISKAKKIGASMGLLVDTLQRQDRTTCWEE